LMKGHGPGNVVPGKCHSAFSTWILLKSDTPHFDLNCC
jgi:hypothetical protein